MLFWVLHMVIKNWTLRNYIGETNAGFVLGWYVWSHSPFCYDDVFLCFNNVTKLVAWIFQMGLLSFFINFSKNLFFFLILGLLCYIFFPCSNQRGFGVEISKGLLWFLNVGFRISQLEFSWDLWVSLSLHARDQFSEFCFCMYMQRNGRILLISLWETWWFLIS